MNPVFIYALCEPGTRCVRYIGKTNNLRNRLRQHLTISVKETTHLGNWLRSLAGKLPNQVLLREVQESEGGPSEIKYIRIARALNLDLVNATDGGDGGRHSEETRRKLRDLNLGEKNAMFGRRMSTETRAKMSAAGKGRAKSEAWKVATSRRQLGPGNHRFGQLQHPNSNRRGTIQSAETREKMAASHRARWARRNAGV